MERHKEGTARVIAVILRPCDWQHAPFGRLRACPTDGKPVVKHVSHDDGFLEVAQAVRQVATGLQGYEISQAYNLDSDKLDLSKVTHENPHSRNLRVKRKFTDQDYCTFIHEAFEFIFRYFENSMQEMQVINNDLKSVFRRIDANSFEAIVFIRGQEKSRCGIWLGGMMQTDQLFFSFDGDKNKNSYNESISVRDDGYSLFLEPMGIARFGQMQGKKFNFEESAEYFWTLFVEKIS